MGRVLRVYINLNTHLDGASPEINRFNVHEAYLFAVQQAGRYTPKGRIDTIRGAPLRIFGLMSRVLYLQRRSAHSTEDLFDAVSRYLVSIRYEYLGVELPAIDFVETNMVEGAQRCLVRSDPCAFKKVLNKAGKKWERLEFEEAAEYVAICIDAIMRMHGRAKEWAFARFAWRLGYLELDWYLGHIPADLAGYCQVGFLDDMYMKGVLTRKV